MAIQLPIFMDYHSTTPVDPRVLEEMLPYFTTKFGNAASRSATSSAGRRKRPSTMRASGSPSSSARRARRRLSSPPARRESDNLAIKGVAEFYKDKGNHIITTVIEHKAILDTCKRLEKEGFDGHLPRRRQGRPGRPGRREEGASPTRPSSSRSCSRTTRSARCSRSRRSARSRASAASSSTRTRCRASARSPFDVQKMNVDLASLTAHKMYGPKGVGALYVRRSKPRVRIVAQMDGGGHERGMRSGTLNVPGIVGFGKACRDHAARGERRRTRGSSPCASASARSSRASLDEVLRQRLARAPPARQPQHLVQLRRGRGADDGDQGRRVELGLGVHVGEPRAELRAPRARRRRRARALEHPLRARPVQHRGRGRLRGRPRGRRR